MGPPELVIFDCDGVLVDSERLAIQVESRLITSLGWTLTPDDVLERFVGRSDEHMLGEIVEGPATTVFTDMSELPALLDPLRAQVLDHEPAHRTLLLDRCEPGTRLGESPAPQAEDAIISLVRRLSVPAGAPFGTLADDAAHDVQTARWLVD